MAKKQQPKPPKHVISKAYARKSITEAIAGLNKELGKPLFLAPTRRYIPSRYAALDVLLGGEQHPGWPTGVFIEVVGNASAGKTSFYAALIDAIINQPADTTQLIRTSDGIRTVPASRRVLVLDFEHTLDIAYLLRSARNVVLSHTDDNGKMLNAADANVFVHQPEVLEEGVEIAVKLIESGEFGAVVIDSIPAMLPIEERDKSMMQSTMGKHAQAMGKFFRRVTPIVTANNVIMLMVNQWRDKIGVAFGDPRTSPGGRAREYFDSIKLDISGPKKTPWFPEGGKIVNIKTMKNKITGRVGDVAMYHLSNELGISPEVELTEACISHGLVNMTTVNRPVKVLPGTSKEKTLTNTMAWFKALRRNQNVWNAMHERCRQKGSTFVKGSTSETVFGD